MLQNYGANYTSQFTRVHHHFDTPSFLSLLHFRKRQRKYNSVPDNSDHMEEKVPLNNVVTGMYLLRGTFAAFVQGLENLLSA